MGRPLRLAALVLFICLVDAAASTRLLLAAAPDIDSIRSAKRAQAVRTDQPIHVDGVLDEHAWERAPIVSDFYQQQPAEFELATRRTEVRFLYDNETLYVGAILYDENPEGLIINELKRDFGGSSGDGFGLILDTFQDRRSAYGFITNPGGAQRESLGYDNGRRNDANWHGVWFVRTAILENGWSVEYAIPFKTLRFPERDVQEWGMNMVRWARRANETSTWAPVPRQFTHYNVAYAGTLSGMTGATPGRNLQVKPFLTGQTVRTGLPAAPWTGDGDGGVDLKWGITSSLLLDATWRTDFSQVEADEQQINLTRFSLFFPEKREFFLESPTAFQIGLVEDRGETARRELVPFFSRRIGLSSDGQPIPVVGGLRLTGRAGQQTVGLMTMRTEDFDGRPADTFAAVRVARELTSTTLASAFYFGRESSGVDPFNRVFGGELRLRPRRTVEVEAFAMHSSAATSSGWAGRGSLRVDGTAHRVRLGYVHVDDSFRHDLGFVPRRGIGTMFSSYTRVFRPASATSAVREYTLAAQFDATSDDRLTTSLTRVGGISFGTLFMNTAEVRAWANSTFERLDRPFGIGPVLSVPAGVYRFEDAGVSLSSNRSAALSAGLEMSGGEFWTGDQRTAAANARYRVSANLAAEASVSRSIVRLPEGSLTADLVGLRVDWSFNPRMFLNAFVQYNGETDTWLSNIRYHLMHRPLSDIFVVWNETRLPGEIRRALMLKYTHLIAF